MHAEKLIRDKIIEIASSKGQNIPYRIAKNEEHKSLLLDKLKEEVNEFIQDQNEEELADILEVIDAINKTLIFKDGGIKIEIGDTIVDTTKHQICENLKRATDDFIKNNSLKNRDTIIKIVSLIISVFSFSKDNVYKIKINKYLERGGFEENIVGSFINNILPVNPKSFLFSCIKQYKNWYLIILLGPIIGGFYSPIYNYAIKLLINKINASANFDYIDIIQPIIIFILARLSLDIGWRISELARLKAEPLVKKNIILNAYNIIQNSEYRFFQNHNSGNITSKIKGLIDSYEALSKELFQSGLSSRMCKNIISILAIAIVNFWLGLFIFVWSFAFIFIIFKLSKKLSHLALIDSQEKHSIIGVIGDKITNILSVLLFSAKQREYIELANNLDHSFIIKQKNLYKYSIKL